ncbi:MAG: DUF4124 domain-containing protein [Gammaproteobacteria bacterium]|nr:DUF4124 domain-containing protein [Gammaproteobacteria bacterium]
MKYLLSIALLFVTLPVQAEIYRWVDEEGDVHYSDIEQPNSELIPTPTPNAIPMPKPEVKKPVKKKEESASYKSFRIVSPAHDSTITSSPGNLPVSLSIDPDLNEKNGDYIRLSIDNQVVVSKTSSLSTQISSIDRGTHTLNVELVNSSGKTLMRSSAQFHMKRTSILH